MTAPAMKTLRVSLIDMETTPGGPGGTFFGEVWCKLTKQIRTMDGQVIPFAPIREVIDSTGIVDFSVPANDDTGIHADDRGFGVKVGWDLTADGAHGSRINISNAGTTVLVTTADPDVVLFASKAEAVPTDALSAYPTEGEVTDLIAAERGTERAHQSSTYAPVGGMRGALPRVGFGELIPVTNYDADGYFSVGTVTYSSTNVDFGLRSAQIVTAGGGEQHAIGATAAAAFDLTGRIFRLNVKVDVPTKLHHIQLESSGDAWTTHLAIPAYGSVNTSIPANVWTLIDFDPLDAVLTGVPDQASQDQVVLYVYDDVTAVPVTVTFGSLFIASKSDGTAFTNGVVSLTFDDTYATQWTVGRPRMDLYGFRGTLFPILDAIGSGLTQAQIDALVTHGWEVGAHASTAAAHTLGMVAMTSAQRLAELSALQTYQRAHGYSSNSFAWPLGIQDAASVVDVSGFYSVGRGNNGVQPQHIAAGRSPYNVNSINVDSLSTSACTSFLDNVKARAWWGCLTFHDLTDPTKFNAIIDYVATLGIPVRTMGEVVQATRA